MRLLEHLHGALGWLALAALVHPALLLRRRPSAHLAVVLACGLITLAAGGGVLLYPAYREEVKGAVFRHSAQVGLLFERKEHLSFGAVLLAWGGGAGYWTSCKAGDPMAQVLRRFAARAFAVSALLAGVASVCGAVVASVGSF
ncbi:MAG: hypothetical protein WCI05_03745 [Myxococcales bacterium]